LRRPEEDKVINLFDDRLNFVELKCMATIASATVPWMLPAVARPSMATF